MACFNHNIEMLLISMSPFIREVGFQSCHRSIIFDKNILLFECFFTRLKPEIYNAILIMRILIMNFDNALIFFKL